MRFTEIVVIRLPTGTLARVRERANQEGTKPAEMMRQAIWRAVNDDAPASDDDDPANAATVAI